MFKSNCCGLIFLLLFFAIMLPACGKETAVKKETGTKTAAEYVYSSKEITMEEGFQAEKLCTDGETLYVLGHQGSSAEIIPLDSDGKTLETLALGSLPGGSIACFQKTGEGFRLLMDEGGSYEMIMLDREGKEQERVKLDVENVYLRSEEITDSGEVYADSEEGFFWFGEDGKLKKQVKRKSRMSFGSVLAGKETAFCVCDIYEKEMQVYEYGQPSLNSSKNKEYLEPISHSTKITPYGNARLTVCQDKKYDFYLYDTSNLYGYSLETETSEKLLNWLDCDLDGTGIGGLLALSDGSFAALLQTDGKISVVSIRLSEKKEEDTVLTAAVLEEDANLKKAVLNFNRNTKGIRLSVRDYSGQEDPKQALHQDLLSGQTPDIVKVSSLDIRDYSGKGILMDLSDYLEDDEEISEDDFLPGILNACRTDGKIYCIPASFYVTVLAGEKDVLKTRERWGIEEFSELYRSLKKGQEIMAYYVDQADMLETLCFSMLPAYVDLEKGSVDFHQDSFGKLLECAKNTKWNENDDVFKVMEKIQNGTILLSRFFMGGYRDYALYKGMLREGEVIGLPSETGNGYYGEAADGQIFAVLEKSSHKKEAFEFLKSFWSYDYQKEHLEYGYPTRKDALEEKLKQEMADTAGGTTGTNGVSISYGAMTEEEEEKIRGIVESVDRISWENSREKDIISIIGEEAGAYFAGEKTIEETEDMIENRVKLYVNEKN